jgi:hypothetical protein
MKRFIAIAILIACVGFVGYVFYTFSKSTPESGNPWSAVPSNSEMIIKINQVPVSQELLESILPSSKDALLAQWSDELKGFLSSIASKNYQAPDNILYATNTSSEGLLIIPYSDKLPENELADLIKAIVGESQFQENDFESTAIFNSENITYATIENKILISRTSSLVEAAIIESLKDQPETSSLMVANNTAAKDVALTIFGKWDTGEWMSIEPHRIDESNMLFTGYAVIADTAKHRFNLAANGSSSRLGDYLPSNTVASEIWTYSDIQTARERIDAVRSNTNEELFWSQAWGAIGDSCQCDLNAAVLDWRTGIQGTFAIAYSDSATKIVYFAQMSDSVNVAKLLGNIAIPTANGNIFIKYPEIFRRYASSPFLAEHSFGCQIGDCFYTSDTEEALIQVKNNINQGNSLQRSVNINAAISSDDCAIACTGGSYLTGVFPKSLSWIFSANEKSGGTITRGDDGKFMIQWKGSNNGSFTEKTKPNEPSVAPIEADTVKPAVVEPQPIVEEPSGKKWDVINHNTKEKETLRQNKDNSISLLDKSGKELWKAALPAAIVGEVTQVDALNNGKLQMAFACKNSIYVIDRNGKSLAGFPVAISSEITTGLAVLDYDKSKNYRLLVGTTNGNIYNYTIQGTSAKGWSYGGGARPIKIEHQKVSGEDRIVVTYKSGEKKKFKKTGLPA